MNLAFLPSVFSLWCLGISISSWLLNYNFIAIGSSITSILIGWPFSVLPLGIISIPFLFQFKKLIIFFIYGIIWTFIILVYLIIILIKIIIINLDIFFDNRFFIL